MDESGQRAIFEQTLEEEVRMPVQASDGFNTENKRFAYKWLEEKAQGTKRRTEAAPSPGRAETNRQEDRNRRDMGRRSGGRHRRYCAPLLAFPAPLANHPRAGSRI
jgi:hypothetical protein